MHAPSFIQHILDKSEVFDTLLADLMVSAVVVHPQNPLALEVGSSLTPGDVLAINRNAHI